MTLQPMPDLTPEQYAALRDDIERNGITVPVIVDQHGRVLDGHNRTAIAEELGIPVPRETRVVVDDNEALDVAVALNCARRHLTREQVREVIRSEVARRPDDSDRAIARRVGCSPSTVGAVRRPPEAVSKLDISQSVKLEEALEAELHRLRDHVAALVTLGLQGGISSGELVMAVTRAERLCSSTREPEVGQVFRAAVWAPVIDAIMSSPQPADFLMPDEARTLLLEGIATVPARAVASAS